MNLHTGKIKSAFLIISWALYDLANQFFALNIVSLYFVRWLTIEKHTAEIFYSISYAASTLLMALLSPLLGAVSDETKKRKPFLITLTLISVVFTMLLGATESVWLALLFFAIANFGCQTAVVFYNSLLINIAPGKKTGLVSGVGRMFGYSGAIVALYLIKPIVLEKGYHATFFPTGVFFLIFSLPCLIFVKDAPSEQVKISVAQFFKKEKIVGIFRTLKQTLVDTYANPDLLNFLKACFFGLCSVSAMILFMSVYATKVFNLGESQLINLVAFSTLFAIIGSIGSGFMSDYIGHKRFLGAVFCLWMVCFLLGAIVTSYRWYWWVGALVGLALGSIWTVARALIIKLVPEERIGEVFGLFNFVGYISGLLGVLFWGAIVFFLSSWQEIGYRIALLSLAVYMAVGFVFLLRIRKEL